MRAATWAACLRPGWALPSWLAHACIWLQVQDLFEAEGNDRLKLLVLYSGEDDELLQRAAAGGLAMLTCTRPSLCSRIPQVVSVGAEVPVGGPGSPCRIQPVAQASHLPLSCRPHTGWRSCRLCF